MKFAFYFFFVIFSINGFSQSNDSVCNKARWISIKNTDSNKVLFTHEGNEIEKSLIRQVKYLVESKNMNIYKVDHNFALQHGWFIIPDFSVNNDQYVDYLAETENFFTITNESKTPLVDDFGEPIIVYLENGRQDYIYSNPEIYSINMNEITEIRIEETKNKLDLSKDDYHLKGFSFCLKANSNVIELFWVDANEFKQLLEGTDFPWYNFLFEKKYSGFQYMQIPCIE